MSAIDPTCLPWQTKHDFDIEGETTIIGNVDGEVVDGTTHHTFDFVARTLDEDDDSQSRSVAAANAHFIVRACNSHAVLLWFAEQIFNGIDTGLIRMDTPADETLAIVLRKGRAAMTRARAA